MEKIKNLIVAPHQDDETLGCGGVLAKFGGHVLYVTKLHMHPQKFNQNKPTPWKQRVEETEAVCKYLKIKYTQLDFRTNELDSIPIANLINSFEDIIEKLRPTNIFLPPFVDYNQDHRAIHQAFITALRPADPKYKHVVPNVYVYEYPPISWGKSFQPTLYVPIDIEKKIHAYSLHKSQVRDDPNPRSIENLRKIAEIRGSEIGVPYAEAFEVVRSIMQ